MDAMRPVKAVLKPVILVLGWTLMIASVPAGIAMDTLAIIALAGTLKALDDCWGMYRCRVFDNMGVFSRNAMRDR